MKKQIISTIFLSLTTAPLWAKAELGDDNSLAGFFQNPMLLVLSFIAVVLLFVIWALAKVALMVIKKRMEEEKNTSNKTKIVSTIALLFLALQTSAQDDATAATDAVSSYVLSQEAMWVGIGVILAQVLIIGYLFNIIRKFTRTEMATAAKESKWAAWMQKMQKSTPIENEGDIDLGHNYDGIRELDNPTPPWWRIAFAATILFAPIYLYRYHVAHSAPLQIEELAIEIEEGERRKKEYLATAANAIDENNIAGMEGIEVAAGANIYAKNCVACHGQNGEGNAVGPNLTDTYWLHNGGIEDIFKSVKYGWPEKGMKSWQAEMSSLEMAQVTFYVASLQGTNPPGAKEPQGQPWVEGEDESMTDLDAAERADSTEAVEEAEEMLEAVTPGKN